MFTLCMALAGNASKCVRLAIYVWLSGIVCISSVSAIEITESQPSGVGQTAATLRVVVGPVSQAGNIYFTYGSSPDQLINSTGTRVLSVSNSDTLVTAFVSGLQCGTSYYYSAVVNADGMETISATNEFSTNPCINTLASVELLAAENIGKTSARIRGAIDLDKEYESVTYHFEFGETSAYGQLSNALLINSRITSRRIVDHDLFNLACSTAYHYRMIVDFVEKDTGVESSLQSGDMSFTTLECGALEILSTSLVSQGKDHVTVDVAVDTQGIETEVYFQYGLTRELGSTTESFIINYGSVTTTISELTCGTVYYFNAVAKNALGEISSDIKQSATKPCSQEPTAITLDATDIGVNSALLHANVFPNESPTKIYFEWGLNVAYGYQSVTKTLTGGFSGQIVQEVATALDCATLYYFRITAENEAGKTFGKAQNFVTADCGSQQDPQPDPPVDDSTTMKVTSGATHSLAIGPGGTVIAWGENRDGQLGGLSSSIRVVDGVETVQGQLLRNVTKASAGNAHSLLLFADGSVQAFGNNAHGQLGIASDVNFAGTPFVVRYEDQTALTSIVDIVAGGNHSAAVRDDGKVLVWGSNSTGQLAKSELPHSNFAIEVESINEAVKVTAGKEFVIALLQSKILMAWGANESGQLGDGSFIQNSSPGVVNVVVGAVDVAAGAQHALAVLDNGSVYAWGNNERGQLGQGDLENTNEPAEVLLSDGSALNKVVKVAAGISHSVALLSDGTLMAWGSNINGQLGTGDEGNRVYPGPVLNGVAIVQGEGKPLDGIIDIAAGDNFTIALSENGSIFGWGENLQGQVNGRVTGVKVNLTNLTNSSNSIISLLTPRLVANAAQANIGQNASARIGVRLSKKPEDAVTVNAQVNSGEDFFAITGDAAVQFNENNWFQYQFITVQLQANAHQEKGNLILSATGLPSLNIELHADADPELKSLHQVAGSMNWQLLLVLAVSSLLGSLIRFAYNAPQD